MRIAPMVKGAAAPVGRRSRRLVVLVGVMLMLTLGACGEDGPLADVTLPSTSPDDGGGEAPEETDPPEETSPPEETAPPETEAPAETPDDGDGLSGQTIALIAVLGGLAIAAILGVTSIMSSRSKSKESERAGQRSRLAELIGGFRWIHDQGTMEIMRTSDPTQLQRAWQTTSARMVDLEGTASSMAVGAGDQETANAFNDLGRASAALRAAMESDVSLRSDPANPPRDDLVLQSSQMVQQRRQDLNVALSNPVLQVH